MKWLSATSLVPELIRVPPSMTSHRLSVHARFHGFVQGPQNWRARDEVGQSDAAASAASRPDPNSGLSSTQHGHCKLIAKMLLVFYVCRVVTIFIQLLPVSEADNS